VEELTKYQETTKIGLEYTVLEDLKEWINKNCHDHYKDFREKHHSYVMIRNRIRIKFNMNSWLEFENLINSIPKYKSYSKTVLNKLNNYSLREYTEISVIIFPFEISNLDDKIIRNLKDEFIEKSFYIKTEYMNKEFIKYFKKIVNVLNKIIFFNCEFRQISKNDLFEYEKGIFNKTINPLVRGIEDLTRHIKS
jgi:hypothetical protein